MRYWSPPVTIPRERLACSAADAAKPLSALVQGRTNRQTPEWASTHPLSENRMQRALAAARAPGRVGTGIRNRDTTSTS